MHTQTHRRARRQQRGKARQAASQPQTQPAQPAAGRAQVTARQHRVNIVVALTLHDTHTHTHDVAQQCMRTADVRGNAGLQ